jgi:transposase
VQPDDPRIVQLRELSRLAEDLTQERGRLANRLRTQLLRVWPAVLTLAPAADEPWLWALLERAPTPARAQRLPRRALGAVLASHRIRRVTAEALHAVLQEPRVPTAPGTVEAVREHIAVLLPRLRLVAAQQTHCARRLDDLLAELAAPDATDPREHRDVTILRSLPGVGRVVAATMLAEAARPLAARDYQMLRAYAGVAPVTRQSGKTRLVSMRRSCSGRVRTAVFHWAANSIRLDPRWRTHYDRLRQRHGHARALRGIADRLLGVLVAMLSTGTLYDPARWATRAA